MESNNLFKSYETVLNQIRYDLLFKYTEEKRALVRRNESSSKLNELKEKYKILLEENTNKMRNLHEKLVLAVEEEITKEMNR
ncbi:hypothetical protein A5819_000044 [Enterococcus sp. 7E2_DIV0204]|uniref:hypothetical protein n=1 Tax=unclassified Enterococcus TaxID=2608891 RepID=UPI000A341DDF|nr:MULTISPECIES: hypothetical protein [unclassified Enterococcus]OTN87598.1 hypothetical protein A5819_000044 [Enterococcus sp. 7E2_DIV0204]OTP49716.1 hypothetical protein A5884_002916 [Enterococcus sp. 7D2_DIV0200]